MLKGQRGGLILPMLRSGATILSPSGLLSFNIMKSIRVRDVWVDDDTARKILTNIFNMKSTYDYDPLYTLRAKLDSMLKRKSKIPWILFGAKLEEIPLYMFEPGLEEACWYRLDIGNIPRSEIRKEIEKNRSALANYGRSSFWRQRLEKGDVSASAW